jgi:hypothetical protein
LPAEVVASLETYDLQRWYFCQSHSVPSWFTTSGIRFGSARAASKTGAIRQQPGRSTMRRTLAVTLFLAFPLLTFAQNIEGALAGGSLVQLAAGSADVRRGRGANRRL